MKLNVVRHYAEWHLSRVPFKLIVNKKAHHSWCRYAECR